MNPWPSQHDLASLRADALAAWMEGVRAVRPEDCVRRALDCRPDLVSSRTLIVSVGKAAAGMLRGAIGRAGDSRAIVLLPEASEAGELPASALVLRGGHPFPTPRGIASTERILVEVGGLGRDERLLLLLSGGASALLESPVPGLSADDLVLAHRRLVASGLPIRSINLVRGCLSAVKAGRLAERAGPAAVTTLAISDVEGDDAAVIGSGPTVPGGRSRAVACGEALEVVRAARVDLPAAVMRLLVDGRDGPGRASNGDASIDYTVVASMADAVAGAQAELVRRGYDVAAAEGAAYLRGDTREAARRITATLDHLASAPRRAPGAAVFGGETTVTVASATPGRGGRNLDLAARVALAVRDRDGAVVAAAGTDGCDGSSRAAGAIIDGGTAMRAETGGRALAAALAAFDTEPALEAAGDLLVTGPTGTNVGDLVIALASGR